MSDQTFITNENGKNLRDRFTSLIKDTKLFDVLVGYFYTSGFKSIYPSLEKTEKIRILIGISTNRQTLDLLNKAESHIQSHKQILDGFSGAIKNELEITEDNVETEESISKFIEWLQSKKIEIKAYPHEKIHSKLYIMTFAEGDRDKGRVITGSSNFTENGLINNIEFNVELKNPSDYDFAKDSFERLWKEGVDLSKEYIETINKETWLNDTITPYELYLKFLYEYFKEEINQEDEIINKYRPENFRQLKYQDHAVINAKKIINEYGGVFLSDVVGLGKTYMGTMLCQELAGRTLIIAPPHLIDENNQGSWENAFKDFGFRSRDYQCRSIGLLEKIIDREEHLSFDNVLIDEAHNTRNEETERFTLLSQICSGKKVILVTATPYHNSPMDLLAQIKLFQKAKKSTIPNMPDLQGFFGVLAKNLRGLDRVEDRDEYLRVTRENSKLIREKVLKYLMVRRTRREIMEFYGDDLAKQKMKFPKIADPKPIFYKFNNIESDLFNKTIKSLTHEFHFARYSPMMYLKNIKLENFDRLRETNMTTFMRILLIKRLESSFYAFKKTLSRFIYSYERFIEQYNQGEVYVSKKYSNKIYDYIDQEDFEAIDILIESQEAQRYLANDFNENYIEHLEHDLYLLKEISSGWNNIERDPKIDAFKSDLAIEESVRKGKALIFSESEETAEYLFKELQSVYPNKILYFSSKSSHNDREIVINNFDANAFQPRNDFKLLITTDVLAEGVNLHASNVVINYDIPWNPTKIMQRVGRINRVDTKYEEIFTYTFFPTDDSDDLIKLKSSAESKIAAFISLLGSDAKLLTDNEEIEAHNLFTKLISKEAIEGEDEVESELGYLQEIRKLRDENPSLFNKIKRLPKKARSARKNNKEALITYLRKGRIQKFFYVEKNLEPIEKDFIEAANILKANPNENKIKFGKNYYELLNKNKNFLDKSLEIDIEDYVNKRGSGDNASKLIKLLKAKNIRQHDSFTEVEDEYIANVIEELEAGTIPKGICKSINNLIEPEMLQNPIKIISVLKNNIPKEFLEKKPTFEISMGKDNKEVILSEYFSAD